MRPQVRQKKCASGYGSNWNKGIIEVSFMFKLSIVADESMAATYF